MNRTRRKLMHCEECGAAFEPWQEMYSWTEGYRSVFVCSDCFDALFDELTRPERAALIGSEVLTPEALGLPPS